MVISEINYSYKREEDGVYVVSIGSIKDQNKNPMVLFLNIKLYSDIIQI